MPNVPMRSCSCHDHNLIAPSPHIVCSSLQAMLMRFTSSPAPSVAAPTHGFLGRKIRQGTPFRLPLLVHIEISPLLVILHRSPLPTSLSPKELRGIRLWSIKHAFCHKAQPASHPRPYVLWDCCYSGARMPYVSPSLLQGYHPSSNA